MRRIVSGPLTGLLASSLAFCALPSTVLAATPSTALPTLSTISAAATYPDAVLVGPEEAPDDGGDDIVVIDDDEMDGDEPVVEGGDSPPEDDGDIFGDDSDTEPDDGGERTAGQAPGKLDPESERQQIEAEMGLISVVQRQRMLKKKRFEIAPQLGLTINDPYVRHYTFGADLNYWLTNRMALGLTATGLLGALTPRYDNIRFQQGLLLTANKTLWQANVNFTYNPFYGKIAIFNRALLHWELATTIGAGATQTQVIPRYKALHDPFNTITGGGVLGFVARTYMPNIDWISYQAGVRVWAYPDKLEPLGRGPDTDPGGRDDIALDDASAAKDASDFQLAFNVTVFLGVSFFFPTSFEYTTPR